MYLFSIYMVIYLIKYIFYMMYDIICNKEKKYIFMHMRNNIFMGKIIKKWDCQMARKTIRSS